MKKKYIYIFMATGIEPRSKRVAKTKQKYFDEMYETRYAPLSEVDKIHTGERTIICHHHK